MMMNNSQIESKLKWLHELLSTFVKSMNVEEDTFTISVVGLINIVVDVDKEISKIVEFHQLTHVSVAREVSLYCYYFLKRRPIIITDETNKYADQINERFCVFLLLSITENIKIWDQEYIQFLISMFYRGELSKDAMYLLTMTMRQTEKLGGEDDGV